MEDDRERFSESCCFKGASVGESIQGQVSMEMTSFCVKAYLYKREVGWFIFSRKVPSRWGCVLADEQNRMSWKVNSSQSNVLLRPPRAMLTLHKLYRPILQYRQFPHM